MTCLNTDLTCSLAFGEYIWLYFSSQSFLFMLSLAKSIVNQQLQVYHIICEYFSWCPSPPKLTAIGIHFSCVIVWAVASAASHDYPAKPHVGSAILAATLVFITVRVSLWRKTSLLRQMFTHTSYSLPTIAWYYWTTQRLRAKPHVGSVRGSPILATTLLVMLNTSLLRQMFTHISCSLQTIAWYHLTIQRL